MKKLLSILCTGLLLCGAGLTSCENYDDPVTGNAYGNNSIPEGRTISIAALKEMRQVLSLSVLMQPDCMHSAR